MPVGLECSRPEKKGLSRVTTVTMEVHDTSSMLDIVCIGLTWVRCVTRYGGLTPATTFYCEGCVPAPGIVVPGSEGLLSCQQGLQCVPHVQAPAGPKRWHHECSHLETTVQSHNKTVLTSSCRRYCRCGDLEMKGSSTGHSSRHVIGMALLTTIQIVLYVAK